MTLDFITNQHKSTSFTDVALRDIKTRIIYRHIAWLTALRHQLRTPKKWEYMDRVYNIEYKKFFKVPEEEFSLEEDLNGLVNEEEKNMYLVKKTAPPISLALNLKN